MLDSSDSSDFSDFSDWEIRIISFSENPPILSQFSSIFPQVNTSIQQAVDLRQVSETSLFVNNLISMSAFLSMTGGRKWDREVNSKGAVGLAQANRIALTDATKELLLCEDDCEISRPPQFVTEINQLLQNTASFDLAVFGARLLEEFESRLDPVSFMPNGWYYLDTNSHFYHTHCVFYTKSGRKKVGEYLTKEKLEMQIDGLFATMNKLKMIRVLVQITDVSAIQSYHPSTIQTDTCPLCHLSPGDGFKATRELSEREIVSRRQPVPKTELGTEVNNTVNVINAVDVKGSSFSVFTIFTIVIFVAIVLTIIQYTTTARRYKS